VQLPLSSSATNAEEKHELHLLLIDRGGLVVVNKR